jgi:hypothetical protein
MSDSQIRGSFIRSYSDKQRESWKVGSALIQKRDNEHRALNKAYGYFDKDGTIPIGCKSHVDLEYKRKYDEIEARFREPYESNLPSLYDWCKREGMSIYEYLWIDNIHTEHLEIVAAESTQEHDWQINYIARKAALFVERLKVNHSVGEIKNLIDIEVRNHHYAISHCRKLLDIKPWELGKQTVLFKYRRDWKAALENVLNSSAIR